MKSYLY